MGAENRDSRAALGWGRIVSVELVLFYVFAAMALVSALGMLLNFRNTVASAMSLVVTMVSLAGIFLLLGAHLIAVIQIMVYGGAIVVLFLFVVMLLNLRRDEFPPGRQRALKVAATLAGAVILIELLRLLPGNLPDTDALPAGYGTYAELGIALYTDYVLLVEMASLLLLGAIVGALILAKRKIE
jgi:NADH-quinone oxidoreductase subunit J